MDKDKRMLRGEGGEQLGGHAEDLSYGRPLTSHYFKINSEFFIYTSTFFTGKH